MLSNDVATMARIRKDHSLLLYLAFILILLAIAILLQYYLKMAEVPTGDIGIDFSAIPLNKSEVRFFGWVTTSQKSIESFIKNAAHFAWVSPTGSEVDSNGNFLGKVDPGVIETAKRSNVGVVPLVANANFDRDLMHRILTDEVISDRTISSIVKFIVEGNFTGVNIDWENIPPEDRQSLNSYMRDLADRLHAHGKLVTIDVSGKTSDETTGWGGAWDYKALGQITDYVCIMVYDYHWSGGTAGPIGPLSWLEQVIQYALLSIPKDKIVIGIPFYGYDWIGTKGEGVIFDQAVSNAKTAGVKITFSEKDGEYTYSYRAPDGRHEVWFQGALSTEMRISTALRFGIDRIAAWSVGQEDPRTWEVIDRKL